MRRSMAILVAAVLAMSCSEDNDATAPVVGSISGYVTYEMSGWPVAGVSLSMSPSASTVTTDEHGGFLVQDIPAGSCTITASKSGFLTKDTVISVSSGTIARVDFKLVEQLPTTGLVGCYPFEGNANDKSVSENNGVVYGATPAVDRFGVSSRAYSFNGVDNYIKASASNLPQTERTVSIWFFTSNLNTRPGLLGYGGDNTGRTSFIMVMNSGDRGTNEYMVQCHNNVNRLEVTYPSSPIGKWHHWLVTTSATGTTMYLDGSLIASNSLFINNTWTTARDFSIGVSVSPYGYAPYTDTYIAYFDGSLDDIRIYNRELSASEILSLYHEGGW